MELHFILGIIKSVQLRISTDSSSTTNLDVTSFWLIPIFVFMHEQGSHRVTLLCVFLNTPFQLPRD